jgi:hypothetical protein
MIFLENKYTRWYLAIIKIANDRILPDGTYIEKHHIIPKSLGGVDNPENIVRLTAREHFICHHLLTKIVQGPLSRRKMLHALGKFVQKGKSKDRIIGSHQYEIARRAISEARRGITHTPEARAKISKAHTGRSSPKKGQRGLHTHTDEYKRLRSEALTGKGFVERFGEEGARIAIEKMKASKRGKPSGMLGKKHSEETKMKMSKPRQGTLHVRILCPSCGLNAQTPRHIRYCSRASPTQTKITY